MTTTMRKYKNNVRVFGSSLVSMVRIPIRTFNSNAFAPVSLDEDFYTVLNYPVVSKYTFTKLLQHYKKIIWLREPNMSASQLSTIPLCFALSMIISTVSVFLQVPKYDCHNLMEKG